MAIAKISKINIVAHQKNREQIMEKIQDLGLVQIQEHHDTTLEKSNISGQLSQAEYKLAGVKFSLDFLAEYNLEKKSLAEKLNPKIELSELELQKAIDSFDFEKVVKNVQEVESELNESSSIIEKKQTEITQLSPWKNLNFIPNTKLLPEKITFKLFLLTPQNFQDLNKHLIDKAPLSELQIIQEDKKGIRAALIYSKKNETEISEILNDLNLKNDELPEVDTEITKYINEAEIEIKNQEARIEETKRKAYNLALQTKDLKIISDYLTWQRDKLIAQQKTANSWQTFSIIGWLDQKMIKVVQKELSRITNDFAIEEIDPEEDEQIPVIFKNSWASPFEFVTGVYGAPRYGEPDPTPFLAPFFILFFGLCLTDAGYGIVLALLAWLGIKFMKPAKAAKKMFLVLMYGGIVTFFAGAAVGGWFGIVIDDLKIEWLRNILQTLRVIDPVKDPITMLIFSLILGVIQMLAGLLISLWWKVKNGDIKSAILDDAMWLYFLIVMLTWGMHKAGVINAAFSTYLVYAGVIGIIVTQGRKAKNPILKAVNGVISLYGLVGYLSDVLSYSRLLALGLATGIIAMVINLIAALTVDMVPYLGYVIAFFIIIGGHIFNIAINALGSFIHSSRLQFVEFFPKFMEGGGVNLVPVRKESKYTRINNQEK